MENVEFIVEPEKKIPVLMKVDVTVAGAGPAGFAAAISAARTGAKVLLVEESNYVGGLMACLPILGHCNYAGEQMIFGIAQELVDNLVQIGASPGLVRDPRLGSIVPVDSEMLKVVTQKMVEEAGVKLLFHTYAVAPIMDGNRVKGIIVENKSGRQAILSNVVIDATGDGDIAARAGASFEIKDRDQIQPGTLMFRMDHVNVDKIRLAVAENPENARLIPGHNDMYPDVVAYFLKAKKFVIDGFVSQLKEARKNGDIPPDFPMEWVIIVTQPRDDEVAINMAMATGFHSIDAMDLTRAEIEARKRIPVVVNFLKKYIPGFENAQLIASHNIIGVRESRRIIGDYTLTEEDVMQNKRFPDGVAIGTWVPAWGHHPKGKIWRLEERKFPKEAVKGFEVPYRCLLPRGLEGILVAGRCISVTGWAQNSIRVMAPIMSIGQAAGTAAALAAKEGVTPRKVDVSRIREALVKQGVRLLDR